jgi:hypothetical protein
MAEITVHHESTREQFIRVRVASLAIPPIKDGLIIGKRAAIGAEAMERTLQLVSHEAFESVAMPPSDVISHAFIRTAILRKVSRQKLIDFIMRKFQPIMTENEILLLDIEVELVLEDTL